MAASKKPKRASGGPFESLRKLRNELSESPAKKPKNAPPKRTPDERPQDDALDFHRLFSGVTPLDKSPSRISRVRVERSEAAELAARAQQAAQADAQAVHARLRELVETGGRFEVADDGRRVEGRRVDVPHDLLRRLRRGILTIDGRLDLHGMGVKEARAQLELFLRTMRARGERCVLVIHGKGEHSPQGVGVLRGEIAAWLSQGPSSQHVAAFVSAREHDGGEGAVYVLLLR
jgi:DNA-nicking Smr family endonuclease